MVRTRQSSRDAGFTLVELMVTLTLAGVLLALGTMPLKNYAQAQSHAGSARTVVEVMRNAQVRSVAEGTTYKVVLEAHQVRVFRADGGVFGTTPLLSTPIDPRVTLTGPSFTKAASAGGGPTTDGYFYPRGNASKGQLTVVRVGSAKVYTIAVEGLTARVSLT